MMNRQDAIQQIAIHYGVADSPIDGKGFYKKKIRIRDEKTPSAGLSATTGHINDFGGGKTYFSETIETLGIDYVDNGRDPIVDTKKPYPTLEAYAQDHDLTVEQCHKNGITWEMRGTTPTLVIQTLTTPRYKKMDGSGAWYTDTGFKNHWYRGKDAIQMANDKNLDYLVIVNAEISTVAAQERGIPATTTTTGESGIAALIPNLRKHWKGKLILALDCDTAGRDATKAIQAIDNNVVVVDMMLDNHGDMADFCKLHTTDSLKDLLAMVDKQNPIVAVVGHETDINRSDKVRDAVMDEMLGKSPITERYIPVPIKALHKFGGLCEYMTTGQITLIGGDTGTGKTQLLETIVDELNKDDENVMWWGPEWRKKVMERRRIIRNAKDYLHVNGTRYQLFHNQVIKHLQFMGSKQDNLSNGNIRGRLLSQQQFDVFTESNNRLKLWAGTTEYFEMKNNLEETFAEMRVTVARERAKGRRVNFAIFDYAQLIMAQSTDSAVNRYEFALEELKRFAIQENIHVIATTQMTKQAGKDRKQGYMLGEHDALWLRGDKANLFLTINPVFDESADNIQTLYSWLNIAKTSEGGRPDNYIDKYLRIPMMMNPHRFKFETGEDDIKKLWARNEDFNHLWVEQYQGLSQKPYVNENADKVDAIPL